MTPYDPDFGTIDPEPPRERRRAWGPIAVGLAAFPISYFAFGPQGVLAAVLAVASWWAYKFWPRKPAPEPPGVRDFLRSAEAGSSANPPKPEPRPGAPSPAAWDDLKL